MKWLLLTLGIFTEVSATTCMKLSNGFTRGVPSVFTFVFWVVSMAIFILALKRFELSFAYALWAGAGILIVGIVGIIFFDESANPLKIVSIVLISVGIIGLNLSQMR